MATPPHTVKAWLQFMPLPLYSLPLSTISPLSTMPGSATKPAASTLGAVRDGAYGLRKLESGEYIWDRLFAYVSWVPFSDRDLPGGQTYRMWNCPEAPEEPPPQLVEKTQRLLSLILTNSHRQPILLHNNEDMRYPNTLLVHQTDKPFVSSSGNVQFNSGEAAHLGIYYPRWISPVKANNSDKTKQASGFADRLLVRYPERISGQDLELNRIAAGKVQCAHAEAKPGWVYTPTHFADLLGGNKHIVGPGNEGFISAGTGQHPGNQLLRQMWGQCFYLGSKIAFTTNLDGVIILLQDLTEENSGFILSPILPWTDDRLLSCLVGLSFLAVDAGKWANPDANGNATGPTLTTMLAPLAERRVIVRTAEH